MIINTLKIENFKSIEKIDIKPTRVNVFIGEPNAGKTNIIEALCLLSNLLISYNKSLIRFREPKDLFFDFNTNNKIRIKTDKIICSIENDVDEQGNINNRYVATFTEPEKTTWKQTGMNELTHDGGIHMLNGAIHFRNIFPYVFKTLDNTNNAREPYLLPPFGNNIPNLLNGNSVFFDLVDSIFQENGFKLFIRESDKQVTMVKVDKGRLYDYKYQNISSTLQRVIFMLLAITSNKNKVLVFDEPEANMYPFYTQRIAKHIASDKSNQYFMTSHSAYLINKLFDKTPPDEFSVFYTKMKDYKTEVQKLTSEELESFCSMGENAMLNLDNLIP
jgi:AAA15 family ATPase/GTPase